MRKKLSTTAYATLLTAGLVVAAPVPAFAGPETSGSGGVASGNQVSVPADVEAKICGNSVAALGISKAKCKEVAKVLYASSDEGGAKTDGSGGIGSGNQIIMPVDAAVEVCGNSAAVAGVSKAKCVKVVKGVASSSKNEGAETDGSGGIGSGNQIIIPVDVAVEVCGNSVAVGGASKADCTKVVKAMSSSSDNEGAETDGSGGIASGNQVIVPADVAVEICGNAVSAVGVAKADCIKKISDGKGGDDGDNGNGDDNGSDDNGGDNGNGDDNGNGGDNGSDNGDDKGKDNGKGSDDKADNGAESPDEGAESGEDAEVDLVADDKNASGGLPVTGAALGGLVAAGIAALGGGAAAMRFARKRKAAADTDAEV
ncbi:chaplin family protein [Nocardiopsis gilva]|nr:chaplin family protein [Nocardiopsis gilva]